MKKIFLLAALMAGIFGLWSCDGGGGDNTDSIDRKPFLEFTGNNIIVPSYQQLATATANMAAAADAFAADANATTFQALKDQWKTAYLAWQACSAFEFGPADAAGLRANLNIYPTDTTLIKNNVSAGTYNLDALSSRVAKGFPALDYLLYGYDLDAYTTADEASNRKAYVKAVAADINTRVQSVYTQWTAGGGNYIATYTQADGTDQGSSLSMVFNSTLEDYELAKNFKLGLPSGIRSLGQIFPDKVEGYYSGISLELLQANFENTQRIFLGQSPSGQLGAGFEALLLQHKATDLIADIKTQFPKVIASAKAVPGPLSQAVTAQPAKVQEAYNEAQHLVVFLKAELSSVLGVQVSYQDGDND